MTAIINIAAYALLILTGVVILGIALLASITTIAYFARRNRFANEHDGE